MKFKIFGYIIFVAVCLFFSLYARFPGKAAARYIEQMLSQVRPDVNLRIDTLTPCFPPGLKAEAIQIYYAGTPIATLDNSRFFFDLTTLFGNPVTGSFKTGVFDGNMSGLMRVSRKNQGISVLKPNLKI